MDNHEAVKNSETFDANETVGMFDDMATLVILIGASARDTARLMGLESRLVIKTIVTMVMLGVVLGLVIFGIWLSITFAIAAGLYQYTGLGLTPSIVGASVVNVTCAVALIRLMKGMSRKLAFPETRLAVRTLLDDASGTMQKQE